MFKIKKVFRSRLLAAFVALFTTAFSTSVFATWIDVFQDGDFIGAIESYQGTETAADNWTHNRGPTTGPTGLNDSGQIFFYETAENGLAFNVMWNRFTFNDGQQSRAGWDIVVKGTDSMQIEADDNTEMSPVSSTEGDGYKGLWVWGPFADGGIIGGLTGAWEITIDAFEHTDINNLFASDENQQLALDKTIGSTIVLKASSSSPVPAPSTLFLMVISLLGFIRLNKMKKS